MSQCITTYPVIDLVRREECEALDMPIRALWTDLIRNGLTIKAVRNGEFRQPKTGDWYLWNGQARRAHKLMSMRYYIMDLVVVEKKTFTTEKIKAWRQCHGITQ